MKGLVSEEIVAPRLWTRETRKSGVKRVDQRKRIAKLTLQAFAHRLFASTKG